MFKITLVHYFSDFFVNYRFINGVIEFDRKIVLCNWFSPAVRSDLIHKHFWVTSVIFFGVYFLGCQMYYAFYFNVSFVQVAGHMTVVFHSPDIIIFVVFITSCFYLYSLGQRFCLLNDLWQRIPPGLAAFAGQWTNSEIAVVVESIRLLHAELSDLLRLFSVCYGSVLLFFFTLSFVHATLDVYLIVAYKGSKGKLNVLPYVFYLQNIVFSLMILWITSWVLEKVCYQYLPKLMR